MGAEWISLPNVMLVEIFTYLDHRVSFSIFSCVGTYLCCWSCCQSYFVVLRC